METSDLEAHWFTTTPQRGTFHLMDHVQLIVVLLTIYHCHKLLVARPKISQKISRSTATSQLQPCGVYSRRDGPAKIPARSIEALEGIPSRRLFTPSYRRGVVNYLTPSQLVKKTFPYPSLIGFYSLPPSSHT